MTDYSAMRLMQLSCNGSTGSWGLMSCAVFALHSTCHSCTWHSALCLGLRQAMILLGLATINHHPALPVLKGVHVAKHP
jgi:hypothetical protein